MEPETLSIGGSKQKPAAPVVPLVEKEENPDTSTLKISITEVVKSSDGMRKK